MPKMRLYIEKYSIIMKKIDRVIIDDIEFVKDDYKTKESRILTGFYNFVKRNKDKISFISYKEDDQNNFTYYMHLKNCKLHNENDEAIYRFCGNEREKKDPWYRSYYLEGERLDYNKWIIKLRKIKLDKLNK
jgi:hypothetical protein